MSRFTWIPDQGASRTSKPDVNKAQFGDGYSQRSSNGINSINESWSLNFSLRPKSEVLAMVNFLKAAKGVSNFSFVAPDGVDAKFTCDTWSDTYSIDANSSLSATFQLVYEL